MLERGMLSRSLKGLEPGNLSFFLDEPFVPWAEPLSEVNPSLSFFYQSGKV
jgi:hypothetical protein